MTHLEARVDPASVYALLMKNFSTSEAHAALVCDVRKLGKVCQDHAGALSNPKTRRSHAAHDFYARTRAGADAARIRTDPTRDRTDPTHDRTDPTRSPGNPKRDRSNPKRNRSNPKRNRSNPKRSHRFVPERFGSKISAIGLVRKRFGSFGSGVGFLQPPIGSVRKRVGSKIPRKSLPGERYPLVRVRIVFVRERVG